MTERSNRPTARGGDGISVPDNPFYRALKELLVDGRFDEFATKARREASAVDRGRGDDPPGVYSRMLMVGCLEGLAWERGIARRYAGSL